jgi:hypothetical protein
MLDWLKNLKGAREGRAALVAKLVKLQAKRAELVQRAPDRATIVAWFTRSIEAQCTEYESRLERWFFSAAAQARHPGTFFETDASVSLLSVPAASPYHAEALAPSEALAGPSPLALTFYLRDAMLAEVPRLVDKFFPDSARGISAADRAAALAKVDKDIADLEAELTELDQALDQARRVVA